MKKRERERERKRMKKEKERMWGKMTDEMWKTIILCCEYTYLVGLLTHPNKLII